MVSAEGIGWDKGLVPLAFGRVGSRHNGFVAVEAGIRSYDWHSSQMTGGHFRIAAARHMWLAFYAAAGVAVCGYLALIDASTLRRRVFEEGGDSTGRIRFEYMIYVADVWVVVGKSSVNLNRRVVIVVLDSGVLRRDLAWAPVRVPWVVAGMKEQTHLVPLKPRE